MPALICIHGANRGQYFNLPEHSSLIVGRDGGLLFHLGDRRVSREHAEFTWQPQTRSCLLVDLRSHNGTHVNGTRIERSTEIRDGDVVRLGYSLLVLVDRTLENADKVPPFLKACERLYAPHLAELRGRGYDLGEPDHSHDTLKHASFFGRIVHRGAAG